MLSRARVLGLHLGRAGEGLGAARARESDAKSREVWWRIAELSAELGEGDVRQDAPRASRTIVKMPALKQAILSERALILERWASSRARVQCLEEAIDGALLVTRPVAAYGDRRQASPTMRRVVTLGGRIYAERRRDCRVTETRAVDRPPPDTGPQPASSPISSRISARSER